eukprot:m.407643 g.407643  ORF g.407643 m.407643 type:complete len:93 (+) comp28448_c0_seq3:1241-1519(+)
MHWCPNARGQNQAPSQDRGGEETALRGPGGGRRGSWSTRRWWRCIFVDDRYERATIATWFRQHDTSPLTRAVIPPTLVPNVNLRSQIASWRE